MNISFEGRTAFVTGAASGIGRSAVLALLRDGANVIAADINGPALAELQSIATAPNRLLAVAIDVTDEGAVAQAIGTGVERFGRLDCALNNAAVIPELAPTADIDVVKWRRTLEINLTGPLICLKHEIRQMLKQGDGGDIVNLASAASLTAYPGRPGYVASKHGLAGLTKAAAVEYGQAGIRVNALCPALVMTPMADDLLQGNEDYLKVLVSTFPLGRAAQPDEIAEIALLLMSRATGYMTGSIIPADAGFTAQ